MARRKRIAPRFIIILFLLLIAMILGAMLAFRSCSSGDDTPSGDVDIQSPANTNAGFLGNLFNRNNEAEVTPDPTEAPAPTSTPLPEYSPYSVAGTDPKADFGITTALEVDGVTMNVSDYRASETISFALPESYTELKGIITFRGNNFRDTASYGTVRLTEYKIDTKPWYKKIGSLQKMYGEGSWTGCGWTGQPLIVEWPKETKAIMNMYDWAKAKDGLVEVIYATMDGNIYFLDLDSGEETRPYISTGHPFKGAGALDPRGYPLMYVGSGDDSPKEGSGSAKAFIISLIDGSILYTFGKSDGFSLRSWYAFDSSALVDAETDTLIYPAECGILYIIKLNTNYNPTAGTISINPKVIKWRYTSTRTNRKGVDGSNGWWLGIEDSAVIYQNYVIFADNGGLLMCLNLNTLQLVWAQDTLDDTNCTPVLEIENGHPYVYISTSFHGGWRYKDSQMADIPIWKIDAVTGEIVWKTVYNCGTISGVSGGVQGTLVVGKNALSDLIFVPVAMTEGTRGKLVALSKETGKEVWCCDFAGYPWSSPVAIYDEEGNGYLIQCNKTGYIHLIDGRTGTILDEMSLGVDGNATNIEASPAVYGNRVVVGTRSGYIFGITLK